VGLVVADGEVAAVAVTEGIAVGVTGVQPGEESADARVVGASGVGVQGARSSTAA
jgi:hypothetical protein